MTLLSSSCRRRGDPTRTNQHQSLKKKSSSNWKKKTGKGKEVYTLLGESALHPIPKPTDLDVYQVEVLPFGSCCRKYPSCLRVAHRRSRSCGAQQHDAKRRLHAPPYNYSATAKRYGPEEALAPTTYNGLWLIDGAILGYRRCRRYP